MVNELESLRWWAGLFQLSPIILHVNLSLRMSVWLTKFSHFATSLPSICMHKTKAHSSNCGFGLSIEAYAKFRILPNSTELHRQTLKATT